MQSDTVIWGLKMIFSENGSPEILITDNGRSFISKDLKQFAIEWSFVHKTSSPHYLKGMLMLKELLVSSRKSILNVEMTFC